MDEGIDIQQLVRNLGSDDDPVRKKAAWDLSSAISDPSFVDVFIANDGVSKLRFLALKASGNTLAYALNSFSNLLDLDQGWDWINSELIHRFGFAALKPAITAYPDFLKTLSGRLSSADHSLCHNALQLLNAILRDSMANDEADDWDSLFKTYTDLGVVGSVRNLMQDSAVQELAQSLLDFQQLIKMLLLRWKEIQVDFHRRDHRQQIKSVLQASKTSSFGSPREDQSDGVNSDDAKSADAEPWQRIGFQSEKPVSDFGDTGYLGLLDLSNYSINSKDHFQRLIEEQMSKPEERRWPVARASLSVTSILFDHFEIDQVKADTEGQQSNLDARASIEKLFKPLLLQWAHLHVAGMQAFLRLWAITKARAADYSKLELLTRILLEEVVGLAPIDRHISDVETDIATYDIKRLREDQMNLIELTHQEAWGHHLKGTEHELESEASQFMREQRMRSLLRGSWFPHSTQSHTPLGTAIPEKQTVTWRFARLSHNRRYLHYDDFDSKTPEDEPPGLDALEYSIDLLVVSSIGSEVVPSSPVEERSTTSLKSSTNASKSSLEKQKRGSTQIRINGFRPSSNASNEGRSRSSKHHRKGSSKSTVQQKSSNRSEEVLLTLNPQNQTLASEWLDGLLALLGQDPVTSETTKLMDFTSKYGMKIRLLNVKFEDALDGLGPVGVDDKELKLPSREGLDKDYYYDVAAL
ncbi:MAG: hypothetical protein Q9162_007757 [Coniocarpon cinnabarinum]